MLLASDPLPGMFPGPCEGGGSVPILQERKVRLEMRPRSVLRFLEQFTYLSEPATLVSDRK